MKQKSFWRHKLAPVMALALALASLMAPAQPVRAATPPVVTMEEPADLTFFSGTAVTLVAEPDGALTAAEIRIRNNAGLFWRGGIGFFPGEFWAPIEFAPRDQVGGNQNWRIRIETFRIPVEGSPYTITMRATNAGGTGMSSPMLVLGGGTTPPAIIVTSPANGANLPAFPTTITASAFDEDTPNPAGLEPFMSLQRASDGFFWDAINGVWSPFETLFAPGVSGLTPNFVITEPDPALPGEVLPVGDLGVFTVFVWAADAPGNLGGPATSTFTVGAGGGAVASLTASDPLLTDADAGVISQTITVTYNQAMNPAVLPTLTFGPDVVAGGTLVDQGPGAFNGTNTIFTRGFAVADMNVQQLGVDVTVTGGQVAADASVPPPALFVDRFSVDTLNPTGVISVNLPTIITAGVGSFQVTTDFSEPMNPAIAPVVAFTPDIVAGGTLVANAGLSGWTLPTRFVAVYDTVDLNQVINGVDVTVTGGRDVAGNLQTPSNLVDAFNVNTAAQGGLLPFFLVPQRGLFQNRTIANLAANDNLNKVTIRSLSVQGTDSTDWFGQFRTIGTAPTRLELTYDGSQSAAVFQVLSVFNFRARQWEMVDSRTMTPGLDVTLNWSTNAPADYLLGAGTTRNFRARVSAYTVGTPFLTSADQMTLAVFR